MLYWYHVIFSLLQALEISRRQDFLTQYKQSKLTEVMLRDIIYPYRSLNVVHNVGRKRCRALAGSIRWESTGTTGHVKGNGDT